jgi:predicted MFS family arabinose efflux permease
MTSARADGWRTPAIVFLTACLLLFLSFGTRATFGLYLQPVSGDLGWGREIFGLSIAIQNIVVGLAQPFTSAIADRYGTGRTIVAGGLCYAAGLALMAHASTPMDAYLGIGVLVGLGLSGTSFAIAFGAVSRVVSTEKRALALGMVGSIGSIGQFAMVPLGQAFLSAYGWSTLLLILSLVILVTLPVAGVLKGKPQDHGAPQSLGEALREASGHRGYRLLICGFFVCGFHVAYIGTHLPAYVVDRGLSPQYGAWALGLVGLFNIIGSAMAGVLGGRLSKRYLLSSLYFGRALLFTAFLIVPMTEVTVLCFGAIMGLMWLSTVPLTSALVAQIFGPRYMATLFGIVFFSHQIGAFLGAWLGGYVFDLTGSYTIVWWVAAALGVMSGILHLPINEKPLPRVAAVAG